MPWTRKIVFCCGLLSLVLLNGCQPNDVFVQIENQSVARHSKIELSCIQTTQ